VADSEIMYSDGFTEAAPFETLGTIVTQKIDEHLMVGLNLAVSFIDTAIYNC